MTLFALIHLLKFDVKPQLLANLESDITYWKNS